MSERQYMPSDSGQNPTGSGEAKIAPETILSPEQMIATAGELLSGFEAEFPSVGEIPAEMDSDSRTFQSGMTAKKVYTPGIGDRPFVRTGEDKTVKDFAPAFVQCFGKTVTMRLRGEQTMPNEEQLHKRVPRIVRGLLLSTDQGITEALMAGLSTVVAHNMELPEDDPKTQEALRAYLWMIGRAKAMIEPIEAN